MIASNALLKLHGGIRIVITNGYLRTDIRKIPGDNVAARVGCVIAWRVLHGMIAEDIAAAQALARLFDRKVAQNRQRLFE
ncbi:hypothetical protein E7V67_020240 [[Empedobacter] haloabium]|uniref:Uncharacterized protein n=1 Tax=[Empedobacter] haloabium TaxID=592317 RepID=A0ABZ1UH04_9BURK